MTPGKRKAPEGTGADATTRHHLPPTITCTSSDGRYAVEIAGTTRTMSAEASLRLYVNTLPREAPHWWLRTEAARPQVQLLKALGWWTT